MHTYNTNPPASVKQHLQQWLSKCCTKLLNKEPKNLCTRTQLDVKANYALHALTPTGKTKLTWYLPTTHAPKKYRQTVLALKKNQPAAPRAVKTHCKECFTKKKFPNPWQAGTEETTKQGAVKNRSSADATHLIYTNFT